MKRRWIGILWPGFLVAIAGVGVVFTLVDPGEVDRLHLLGVGPIGTYSLGFLFFWLLGAASSAMTMMLGATQP